MCPRPRASDRRGALAVEAAVVFPLLLIMLLGIWEVGRMIQVQQILVNSAREGARLAAGGYTANSTAVTNTMVEQAVRDYLQAAEMPATAVSGANITLNCLESPAWTNPSDADPQDRFTVTVQIPAGAAFESLRWTLLPRLTSQTQMEATVEWVSLINEDVVVSTSLPY